MNAVRVNGSFENFYPLDNSKVDSHFFTTVKVQRAALYVLSTAIAASAAALVAASVTGVVTWPFALISIPLIAASIGLIRYARSFKDYEDPKELQGMRNKALRDSFSQVLKEHGFEKIQKYQILPHLILQDKFIKEHQFYSFSDLIRKYPLHTIRTRDLMPLDMLQKSFAQEIQRMGMSLFLEKFSLTDLHQHGIIPERQFSTLFDLYNRAQSQNRDFEVGRAGLDHKYQDRQERLLAQLDNEEMAARQNATRLKREMSAEARTAGYVTTELMSGHRYTGNSREDHRRHMQARNSGLFLTEFAAVPLVQSMSDRMLSAELEGIQRRRQSILDRKTGEVEQLRYYEELGRLDSFRLTKFKGFDREFSYIQVAIGKAVSL
jgi:hypothetical protein